jgi:hypothetical protein
MKNAMCLLKRQASAYQAVISSPLRQSTVNASILTRRGKNDSAMLRCS